MRKLILAGAVVAVLAAPGTRAERPPERIDLSEWRYDRLEGSWRVQRLLDAPVYDPDGIVVGTVQDVIVHTDGHILGLTAQLGGFLGVGGTPVTVPWTEAKISPVFDRATLRRPPDTYTAAALGPDSWKVRDLIRDYVTLGGRVGFGYVEDLVFDRRGRIQAMIVSRETALGSTGPFAFPLRGFEQGFRPDRDYFYDLPYAEEEVAGLEPIDGDNMSAPIRP